MLKLHVNHLFKGPDHQHNYNTGLVGLKKGTTRLPYKVMGGRWKPSTPFWLENRADMTVFSQIISDADWSADLVRYRVIIIISRGWSEGKKKKAGAKQERWSLAWNVDHWLREECLKTRETGWKLSSGRSTRRPSSESSISWKKGKRSECGELKRYLTVSNINRVDANG